MTVKELIEELKRYSEETRVFIGRMEEDDRGNYDYTEYEVEDKGYKNNRSISLKLYNHIITFLFAILQNHGN